MSSPDQATPLEQTLAACLRQLGASYASSEGMFEALLEHLQCTETTLCETLWEEYGIRVIGDAQWHLARPRLDVFPSEPGKALTRIPISIGDQELLLCTNPWLPQAAQMDRFWGATALPVLALAKRSQWLQIQQLVGQSGVADSTGARHTPSAAAETNVVTFVDHAILQAYREGASDIHFETDRSGIAVKLRIDGVMVGVNRVEGVRTAEEAISRIKVMSQLDITERRRPQDGRIHWSNHQHPAIDLRVSIMPSIFGEDAVLRLLDKAQLRHAQDGISLGSLGFDAHAARAIQKMARSPHGMLLITGPTGSGKTTTIYAALSEVNDGLEKIITIEDPVEYELPGVLQIPVNEQKGLTFATGLRSILRHDPDKILVGEIRDSETAEIAIQSALTGHLVFTTVHANSLFDVLGRFQYFKIDPFALASALNGIVVQRLMRKVCPSCVAQRDLEEHERDLFQRQGMTAPASTAAAVGCAHCRQTGYRGRMVVAEVHALDERLRDLIIERASMRAIREALYGEGQESLLGAALRVVASGDTTLEELARVIGPT